MRLSLCAALAVVASLSGFAQADSISQTYTVPTYQAFTFSATGNTSPGGSLTFSFGPYNPFNTAFGTLTSVVATFSVTAHDTGTLTNKGAASQTISLKLTNNGSLNTTIAPLQNAFGSGLPESQPETIVVAAGGSSNIADYVLPALSSTATFTSLADLAAFENGAFSSNFETDAGESLTGANSSLSSSIKITEAGSLNIVYNYTAAVATPEPSSLMLLGTGLVAVAGFARRRFI